MGNNLQDTSVLAPGDAVVRWAGVMGRMQQPMGGLETR